MAGRAQANFDGMLSRGMKPELIVKGGHSVDLAGCEVKVPGHAADRLRGKVSELFLNTLKNGNKVSATLPEGFQTCG
jgi:hypothetical protein